MENTPPAEELLKKIQELEAGYAQLKEEMSKLIISGDQKLGRQRSHSVSPQRRMAAPQRRRVGGGGFEGGSAAAFKMGSASFRHSSPLQRESRSPEDNNSGMGTVTQPVPPEVKFTDSQYLNILDSMGQSVHIFDLDCRIFYWNRTAERLYGYSATEAHGKTPLDLLADSQDHAVGYNIMKRTLAGESWTGQFPIKTKKGERFVVVCTNTPFYDDNGKLVGVICVSTDSRPFQEMRSALPGLHSEANKSFSPRRIGSAKLGLDPQQPLQVAIASKVSNLASKVSNKVKSKIKTGGNTMVHEGGSEDNHHSDHGTSEAVLSDHKEDALSSGASTPRGEIPPSPFGVFSHGAHDEYSTGNSLRGSADKNDGKPGMHKIITSKAEAWMGKKGISWPWKGNEREGSEPRTAHFVWPWLHNDQENDSAYQKTSSAPAMPESQVSDTNRTTHNEAPGSWSSFNVNSTNSVSSSSSTSSSTVNRVDVDTDSLDYEILWEDLTIGEQIGQGSCGTVYHALWYGSDVAVKVFSKQEYSDDVILAFRQESIMVSPKQLLSTIESTLLGPTPPSPSQRIELIHAIRHSLSSLQSLLSFPPPKPSDRAQVQSREVRLPDSGPISLDDQDVQIVIKLSDDLHLNEIDCVRLLVSANQEWGFLGRDPSEILRLATGLWYTGRRDLLTALYSLLRAVILDPGLEVDLVADIQKYLEDLMNAGLRQRLICLIKELNREEPAGLGGPNSESYVVDSRGALVERRAVVCRERLLLGHCLILSVLVVRTSTKDVKELFTLLKSSAAELNGSSDVLKYQITYSILFSLVIAFISDSLSSGPDKLPLLSRDASFRHEFQENVMIAGNDPTVEGFVDSVRLAWAVHLMTIHDGIDSRETISSASSNDIQNICSCMETIFSNNVFQFLLDKVLQTAAYQNDDEDIIYMYNAYLHKLLTCFLSHPLARDKVKETKEKAMTVLSPYRISGSNDFILDVSMHSQQASEAAPQPFVSLLEFVSEIYQKEPELMSGNDVLWTFVNFAGEDHNNFQTLVAFLKMLSTLASTEEGASKVFDLLQGKTFRSIGWSTLFDCISIYEEKFKQSLQSAGAILPEFQEGDAKALVAYLNVLQKVMENGNPIERKNWFPDIEPLFKLLSYENVPPYLKGALRNAISSFIQVSPNIKDTIWNFLEQYDLPVVVGPHVGNSAQPITAQVYDMRFELNEIEARRERYPSTISFLNLLNALTAEERDVSDRGRRFIGIFRFIYDHVFGPFPQRAYADASEKWQLVVSCLQHFRMILKMYDITDEDIDSVADRSGSQSAALQMQLPIMELLKDFMSGKTVFRNIMGILLPGVNSIITQRTTQIYGQLLEKAVLLCLEILLLVLEKDVIVSDFWLPLYQPLDVILSQDHNQIVALLEYVRYDFRPEIQQCSIKIMSILSTRMVGLVQLLLKSNAATSLIEDYAACLELRSEECQAIENSIDDPGVLIMQLLNDNITRPAPNVTHLLLKFDLDTSIERTLLQPKFHYSCLKVILDILEKLSKPDVNYLLHEFGFQLLYELCLDPLTRVPTMDLLSNKKYQFFVKHLDTVGVEPLPKRNSTQALRISTLHLRAWLLKLLTIELHAGDMTSTNHRETCRSILAHMFGQNSTEYSSDHSITLSILRNDTEDAGKRTITRSKVLELLEVVQFRSPDTTMKYSQSLSNMKYDFLAEDILGSPATSEKGGVYYYSERGDRLIDLAAFRDKLWQKCQFDSPQLSSFGSEVEIVEVRDTIQQLLRWGWKYNKNLEEQAAQLHMLTSWSQIVEVSASRRISSLEDRSEILFQLLDASLSASCSRDCSLKMALILTQVALTCMAKLRDERFVCPGGLNTDTVTCLDIITMKKLSNGACHSILFKLTTAILRHESSEALRRRQYALLLSYFQYCEHMLGPDVPTTVLQCLLVDEEDSEDVDLQKIDKDQAELARANFSILKKEAQAILDLVTRDANQARESGKTMSVYVLDALICIDHEKFFLGQLQSRGFLRSCLMSISNSSYQDGGRSLDPLQKLCTLEAELALLLRISHHYGKSGAQVLSSMGALEHIASCRAINLQIKGNLKRVDIKFGSDPSMDVHKQRMVITPLLRLVFCLTSLVNTSEFFEVKNKVVREVVDFIKGHQLLFDQVLREDVSRADELTMEQMNLVVGILSKVWPYEESDEYGFVQGLFGMMRALFARDPESLTLGQAVLSMEKGRRSELNKFRLCFSLNSYLYFLVTKKSIRLQVSDGSANYLTPAEHQQPPLSLLSFLLNSVTSALERAAEEKYLLLNKIQDINELSRQEVDEIIKMCARRDCVSSSDNIQKRRYTALVEMCQIVGYRDRLITLLFLLAENVLNIILVHFQDSSYTCDSSQDTRTITYGTESDSREDLNTYCAKLTPILERLEGLSEDKTGHKLKVFHRLVNSLREMTFQKLGI